MEKKVILPYYNYQPNNRLGVSSDGKHKDIIGWHQCGYTSLGICLSKDFPEYATDETIYQMLDDMEPFVGDKPGWGERFLANHPYIEKLYREDAYRVGAFVDAYAQYMADVYKARGVNGNIFYKLTATLEELKAGIDKDRPIFLCTNLGAGHFIPVVGYNDTGLFVKDPAGNALMGWQDPNGDGILYPYTFIVPSCNAWSPDKKSFGILYFDKK